ncbi:sensor histidine kinase [Acrocarpospora corrugata]|uniref:sensor histidine kinase n=1 Tax=Acrocarpospora corrugata TaxID=35763 RepID=UPI001FEAEC31|nr:sensor histidine kinase [Acrocarpospora corrugata]
MTSDAVPVEARWEQFYRWAPYLLLGIAAVATAATTDLLRAGAERNWTVALAGAALALQLWWSRTAPGRAGIGAASQAYYAIRYMLSFTLSWLNPIFAIYALIGYYDADRWLPPRRVRAGLLATAVPMAGATVGGFPLTGANEWAGFAALFAISCAFVLLLHHFSVKAGENTQAKTDTIAELRSANAKLEQALLENAGLHAQLLVQAREAGVHDERRRLAAEIHDTIAQGLAGIVTQLQAAADSAEPATTRDYIERAAVLARQSLGEARRSVHNLGPAPLQHDELPEALEKIVVAWSESTGVRAGFTVTGAAEQLHHEIEAALLRIAQEALANAGRHARPARVGVTLSYMDDEVSLDVRDDGRGFDPRSVPPRGSLGGFGLDGMRARAERVAGTVEIESEPGTGTAVSARVPLLRND